jgi:hypothetical protein
MTRSLPARRRRARATPLPPRRPDRGRTACPRCGGTRYRCSLPDGTVVVLDPLPREGGRYLVNPYLFVVVSVRSTAQSRGDGFVEHDDVCFPRA